MLSEGAAFAAALIAALAAVVLADAMVRPTAPLRFPLRSPIGSFILLSTAIALFALLLVITGAPSVSALVAIMLLAALALVSNIKLKVLGEPLVFTDFALIAAVFRHPQFYVSALRPWQIVLLSAGLGAMIALLARFSASGFEQRLVGLALLFGAAGALAIMLRARCWNALAYSAAPAPEADADADADVERDGLVATLLIHWIRWHRLENPSPCSAPLIPGRSKQLVIIIQCESFTDPVAVFGDPALELPGLAAARRVAWRAGRLMVPGFGAYTMRTEYGVLFGRGEDELGLRRFDPFLTAAGEASFALPNRLDRSEWSSIFVHPHDLRFYGRDALMPKAGFTQLVGEDGCAAPAPGEGRYVTDAAIGDAILTLAEKAADATLIYAVTIENHGPWPTGSGNDCGDPGAPYLKLLGHGDALLARLVTSLPQLGRPVTLCFFGDHRPSIPGASDPGSERHTPYVLVRFGADGSVCPASPAIDDLTPAQLHHTILAAIHSSEAQG